MTTRATFVFKDECGKHFVYSHFDGYPTGAAKQLDAALNSPLHFGKNRFDADDFAAAFVAVNKTEAGGVRLAREQSGDSEYRYEVTWASGSHQLKAYAVGRSSKPIYSGALAHFQAAASRVQTELREREDA